MNDYTLEDTIYITFGSRSFATGAPATLGGSPVVSAYENAGTTEITAGITLGVDHDSRTGLNLLTIAAAAASGYEQGKDYNLVITTGTVGGVSVVGETVGRFSLGRSAAAVDLANATDGLGALKTLIDTVDNFVDTEIADIQGRLPAALIGGRMDSSVGAMASGVLTATAIAADAVTEIQSGLSTLTPTDINTALVNAGLVLVSTDIATLASQTSFTLTSGSTDNDAYNGCIIVITDFVTAVQKAVGVVLDYTGATKTITLANDPAVFTMAATDLVDIVPCRALKPTVDNRTLDVTATGAGGIDWNNIENPTTAQNLSGTNLDVDQVVASVSGAVGSVTGLTAATVHSDLDDIQARLPAALVSGRMDSSVGAMAANVMTAAATAADYVAELQSGLTPPTAAVIADAVWDEVQTGHTTAGTFGKYLDSQVSLVGATTSSQVLQTTTIATLASQTSFTLTAGSADNDAYLNAIAVFTDAVTSTQKAFVQISDYVGATKTITLQAAPAFTIAVGDTVSIIVTLGTTTVVVTPVVGNSPIRNSGGEHKSYSGEDYLMQISGVDSTNTVIDFTALGALVFYLEEETPADVLTITDGSITKTTTYARVTIPAAQNVADKAYIWSIRQVTGKVPVLNGTLICIRAAQADA